MSLVQEYRRQFPWRDWPRALALCPITRGQHILDLGCGPGDLSSQLAARGLTVTGIDRDPELLAAARAQAMEGTLHVIGAITKDGDFFRKCSPENRFYPTPGLSSQ